MLYDPFTLEKLREWRAWDPAVQSTYAPFGRRVKFTDVSIREAVWLLRPEFPSHHRVFENLRGRVQSFFPSPCFFRLSTRSPKDAWRSLDADLGIDPEQDDASERDRKYEQQMRLLRVKSFEDVCIPPRMRARLARTVNGSPVCPVFPVSRLTRLPTISFCLVPFFLQLYRHCKIRSRYSSSIYYYKDGVKKLRESHGP